MEPEIQETESESRFRRYANWSIVIGTGVGASYFLGFLVYHSLVPRPISECGWFIQLIDKHYAATIGVPLSAITAFCIVLLLKVVNTGPVELEAFGFKFRGAAGPVVLWIFCFLAVIFGVYLLWNK
jgi:hypothetical protein